MYFQRMTKSYLFLDIKWKLNGPVPYTDMTQRSDRVVISQYMRPGVTTIVGPVCTTDPSGRETRDVQD